MLACMWFFEDSVTGTHSDVCIVKDSITEGIEDDVIGALLNVGKTKDGTPRSLLDIDGLEVSITGGSLLCL